jgi:hypothetical protein
MFRGSRVKEIAEANQNVFSPRTTTQWWLREVVAKPVPVQRQVDNQFVEEPMVAVQPQAAAMATGVMTRAAEGSDWQPEVLRPEPIAEILPQARAVSAEEIARYHETESSADSHAGQSLESDKENLTWDPKASCFVVAR